MTEKLCRTCCHWGPACRLQNKLAIAECRNTYPGTGWFYEDELCDLWQQREGEPLGTGLSRWWWFPKIWRSASIIHDFRCETDPPEKPSLERDQEWRRNAMLVSRNALERALVYPAYLVVRVYGVTK